jgi:poly(3-hydroxybutyrate) depolymerase
MRSTLLVAFLAGCQTLAAQEPTAPPVRTGFLAETLQSGLLRSPYVVYLPPGYTPARQWPLVVFLHGAGECGVDGWKQVGVGLGPAIVADVARWPFVVLFPQKPTRESQWEDHEEMIVAMLAEVRGAYSIDERRQFLTGISQGGHGAWVFAARHPEWWVAVAPVCGYGEPRTLAPALKDLPLWCFHGEDDKVVLPKQSRDLCAAVERAGGTAALTVYPKVGHDAWSRAYRDEWLPEWFLAAAVSRTCAAYVREPAALTAARIELAVEWSTDAGPPSRGTTTTRFDLRPQGLQWRASTTHDDTTPERTTFGTLDSAEGRKLVFERLRALQAAGVFDLPASVDPVPYDPRLGARAGSRVHTLQIVLEGRAGAWRWQRTLPDLARYDARYERAVGAIAACEAVPKVGKSL